MNIISIKTLIFIAFFLNSLQVLAEKVSIRTYCFYVPTASLKKSPEEQIKISNENYEKLMQGTESLKIDAEFRQKVFQVDEKQYLELFDKCTEQIADKGQILDLKGSDAAYYETLTSFYRISMKGTNESLLLTLDDPSVVANLGANIDPAILSNAIYENRDLIKKIAQKIKSAGLRSYETIKSAMSTVAASEYTSTALTVATILAGSWFAPAYVAGAVEVLYPMVYGALFGVPSKFGLTYWLVYYPGKMHAVAWAYNNASAIIATSSLVLGTGYKLLTWSSNKNDVKTGIAEAEAKLSSSKN